MFKQKSYCDRLLSCKLARCNLNLSHGAKTVFWALLLSMLWMSCEELLNGTITILSPDNKITWEVGLEDAAIIVWQTGNVTGKLRIRLMLDHESVMLIKDSVEANEREYFWTVPGIIDPGQGYSVFLESYDDSSAWAESRTFRINPYVSDSNINVHRPKQNDRWQIGLDRGAEIIWDTENLTGLVNLVLYQEQTPMATIADSIPADQDSLYWTVPDTLSPADNYHVVITSLENKYLTIHGSRFSIVPPDNNYSLTVLTPASNTRWEQGLNNGAVIEWSSEGLGGTISIDLMSADTSVVIIADSVDISSLSYSWTVPLDIPAGRGYQIRLKSNEIVYMIARSRQFRIDPYDETSKLELTAPTRDDTWYIGKENNARISWAYHNLTDSVRIELHRHNSTILTITEAVAVDSGEIFWTVPDSVPADKGYQIYIESSSTPELNNLSDNFDILLISDGAELNIISPVRGAEWFIGAPDLALIEWSSLLLDSTIRIELYERNNYLFTIADEVDVQSGTYFWTVPDTVAPGKGYIIHLVSNRFPEVDAFSGSISIKSPDATLGLITPKRGEDWIISEPNGAYISWTSEWLEGNIRIDLYERNNYVMTISDSVDVATGNFIWTVPDTITPGKGYQVYIESEHDPEVNDISSSIDIIEQETSLTLLTPERGDEWVITEMDGAVITWTSEWLEGNIQIDLYDRSTYVMTISDSVEVALGTFDWTVPETIPPGRAYKVSILSLQDPEISDISGSISIITPESRLQLITPKRGEEWVITDPVGAYISWSSAWLDSTVHIHLYDQNDFVMSIAEDIAVSDGKFLWTIPDSVTAGSSYHIFLASDRDTTLSDMSDRITIAAPTRTLDIITPGQNDEWTIGDSSLISWSHAWLDSTLRIDLYLRNSFQTTLFEEIDVTLGSIYWTVSDTMGPGKGYRIYIQSLDDPELDDLSRSFSLLAPQ